MTSTQPTTIVSRIAQRHAMPFMSNEVKAQLALCATLWSLAPLLSCWDRELIWAMLVRFLQCEGTVQLGISVRRIALKGHLICTLMLFCTSCWLYPVAPKVRNHSSIDDDVIGFDGVDTYVQLYFSFVAVPVFGYLFYRWRVKAQLEYRLSRGYWTFDYEMTAQTRRGMHRGIRLSNNPLSVISLLVTTQKMVQVLEIMGLSRSDEEQLIRSRDLFLRVCSQPGATFRNQCVAIEVFFREVSALLARRSASYMVREKGPVHLAVSQMESKFLDHVFDHAEALLAPLPPPLDPDSTLKLVAMFTFSLLLHKRLFQVVKHRNNGTLPNGFQVAKYVTRFGILLHLTGRYLIVRYREGMLQSKRAARRRRLRESQVSHSSLT